MELTKETLQKIDDVIPRYPDKRSAVLMVIHLIQDELCSISDETCEWIAEKLDLQPINVKELITFIPCCGKPHGARPMSASAGLFPALCGVLTPPVRNSRKNWV